MLEQCIEGRPPHKHADKLQSDKDLKEGTKPVKEQRFERRATAQSEFAISIESRAFSLNRI